MVNEEDKEVSRGYILRVMFLEGNLPAHHFLADSKKKIIAAIEIYLGLLFIWGDPFNTCLVLS